MFYHPVWLGFELFESLKFRCIAIGCSFTLAHKGYDNHRCYNKASDRKWGWSVDDVKPGRDGPENLRILKKSQLRLDHGGGEMSVCH